MKYLAYFKPSEEFLITANDYVNSLGNNVSKNLIDTGHCTIMYAAALKEDKEEQIIREFKAIIPSAARDTRVEGLDLFDKASLVARLRKDRYLNRVHLSTIETLRNFIDSYELIGKFPTEYIGNKEREAAYLRYGSVYAGDLWQPHITLCRIKEPIDTQGLNPFKDINMEN